MVSEDGKLSRRHLLGASGAAGAAAAVAGCGLIPKSSSSLKKISGMVQSSDIPILERLLRVEYHLAYAYTASAPRLTGYGLELARWFLAQELEHVGTISGLIKDANVAPNTSAGPFDLGHARNAAEVLALLHGLESAAIRAYQRAIPSLSHGTLRAIAASIVANEGQHVALVRVAQGRDPVPAALVTGSE